MLSGLVLGFLGGFYVFGAYIGKDASGWLWDWPYKWVKDFFSSYDRTGD